MTSLITILSKVTQTDRGVLLTRDEHKVWQSFLDGEVSLKGKLNVLDEKWIQVVFERLNSKVGGLDFQYGGESEVKLEITYIDEKIRLGKGSRGSLFVFQRRKP
ncbi:putative plastid-lipid-associated protein 8, chloroplastic [Datura stramonium]|uniref:Plastid-lipid-associated protein 8, chloroplastic n=1 Tax=Datura stramonium TaxID=4076 RepID=A0ABS8RHT7_DATST|nr:putative plastid-lipid-associated protein 8, chloroplastic [Datura stramonium]